MGSQKKESKGRGGIVQLVIAAGVVLAGVVLLVMGFAAPPLGVIDPSVLIALGELLTFAGALLGIDYHYSSNRGR